MSPLDRRLSAILAAARDAERYRFRRVVEHCEPGSARVRVDGREAVVFCSNDYLGLAREPRVAEALADASRKWGSGSGASHLVTGHATEHHALEQELADFLGRPSALLFSTGYMANLAVGRALLSPGDRVLEDRLNHASLLDAGYSSRADFQRYPHCDVETLSRRLADDPAKATLVLTDGVFSMDGDIAPLRELAETCRPTGAWLFVDDAQGLGVLGPQGRGSVAAAGLDVHAVPILMCTLGKALGSFGAVVAGSEDLIDCLVQRGRTYIYTTALPPAQAAASRAALRLAREESWRRERLFAHVERFRREARTLGLPLLPSQTPIQPLLLRDERAALEASNGLLERGLWVTAIRPPTVPAGTSRLRITLSAAHEDADLDRLLEALRDIQRQGGFA